MVGRRPVLRNLMIAVILVAVIGIVAAAIVVDRASAVTTKPGWRVTTVGQYSSGAGSLHSQLNGDYIVYLGLHGEVLLYRVSTGATTPIKTTTDPVYELRKDGRYVAWFTGAGVWVYDVVSAGPAQLVDTTMGTDLCLSVGRLAWREADGKIHIFNIPANVGRTISNRVDSGLELNGNYMVWVENVSTNNVPGFTYPTDPEIMLHDFSTAKTVNISGLAAVSSSIFGGRDYEPQVAANGFALWTHANFAGSSDIWGYNATSYAGKTFGVSYLPPPSDLRPYESPLTDGRWAVWNSGSDLWLADTQVHYPAAAAVPTLIVGSGAGTGGVWHKAIGGGWLVYYSEPNIWLYDCSTGVGEIVGSVAPQDLYGLQTDGQRIVAEVGSDTDSAVLLFERGSATTTTTTAATGFLPDPNGYRFANLAYSDPGAATAVFTHLFGASLFDSQGAQQSMSASAKQAYVNVSGIYSGGICFGMASTSISYFQRHLTTESITAGVTTLWGLGTFGVTQSNPSTLPATMKWNLEEYYTAQCSSLVHDTMFDSSHFVQSDTAASAAKLKNLVAAIQTKVISEPVVLCIWGMIGAQQSGHAIVAYRVESAADGNSGKIWVYDSNYPGVPHSVSYNLKTGSWSYPELFSGDTMIAYVPMSLVYSVVDSTSSVSYYPNWVYANTACNIAFEDSSGHITGKTSSGYISTNPQVRLEPLLDGHAGQRSVDRYVVAGSSAREFTLQQVGSQAAYAGAHGTAGTFLVCSTGAGGDSVSVTAAYSGADVGFATRSDADIFISAENGRVWAMTTFEKDLSRSGASTGEGRLAVIGSSQVIIERDGEAVQSVSLGGTTTAYTVPSLPDAKRVSIDVSTYDSSDGTLEVRIDVNGDGIYETTDEVDTTNSPAGPQGFWDVAASHPYYTAINGMAAAGVIGGYDDGSFGPSKPVTRQQFAKMIVGTLGFPCSELDICPFSDVANGGPTTLYPDNYVAVAAAFGITNGIGGGKFGPQNQITRAQVITMVVRAAQNYTNGLATPDAAYYSGWGLFRAFNDPIHGYNVQLAEFNGLLTGIQGSGDVATWLWQPATRGEVAQILWKLMNKAGLAG